MHSASDPCPAISTTVPGLFEIMAAPNTALPPTSAFLH
jgi:hypothetical protein